MNNQEIAQKWKVSSVTVDGILADLHIPAKIECSTCLGKGYVAGEQGGVVHYQQCCRCRGVGFFAGQVAPQATVLPEEIIAGALFDFMGFLTTRNEVITLSSHHEAGPAVEALRAFADKRQFNLDEAKVADWMDYRPVQATVEPLTDEQLLKQWYASSRAVWSLQDCILHFARALLATPLTSKATEEFPELPPSQTSIRSNGDYYSAGQMRDYGLECLATRKTDTDNARHPMQPIVTDEDGTIRFKENVIVSHLLNHGGIDMNMLARLHFSDEHRIQFAQLIGYSVSGFGDLSYVTDEIYAEAELKSATPSTIKEEIAPDKHPSALSIAGIARKHFGNPIPPAAYAFASELIAATLATVKEEPTGCPYCTSDNKPIEGNYFGRACTVCAARMKAPTGEQL